MLIEYQADPGRIEPIGFFQCGGGMHLVLRALEEYATVAQGDRDTAHLRILEAFLVLGVIRYLAERLRFRRGLW